MRRICECFHSAGQHLVHIGLMRDIKHQLIRRRVKHIMERYRSLHHAQIRTYMTAMSGKLLKQSGTQFIAKRRKFIDRKPLYIIRGVDFIKFHFHLF